MFAPFRTGLLVAQSISIHEVSEQPLGSLSCAHLQVVIGLIGRQTVSLKPDTVVVGPPVTRGRWSFVGEGGAHRV